MHTLQRGKTTKSLLMDPLSKEAQDRFGIQQGKSCMWNKTKEVEVTVN